MSVAGLAGIPASNSEVIMAVRSEGAAAMDEAAAVSTAMQPAAPTAGPPTTENFEMGGVSENSLDFPVSPTKDEAAASIFHLLVANGGVRLPQALPQRWSAALFGSALRQPALLALVARKGPRALRPGPTARLLFTGA